MRVIMTAIVVSTTLLCATFSNLAAQTANATGISTESSHGPVYQKNARGGWSGVFAGREVAVDRPIVTTREASVRLKIGDLALEILPLSIVKIPAPSGGNGNTTVSVELVAGAVRVVIPNRPTGRLIIESSAGTLRADSGPADFLLDGNRLSVLNGLVMVSNRTGSRRTVESGETLTIPARGFLPQPTRKQS